MGWAEVLQDSRSYFISYEIITCVAMISSTSCDVTPFSFVSVSMVA
jgi:hypothetical protein